jgi:glycosyltransferase involved in cell wall biosynthesis
MVCPDSYSRLGRGEEVKLVVFQSAYSYKTLYERNLLVFATSKDLNGFFEQVITVHASATIEEDVVSKDRYGKLEVLRHSGVHTFVESRAGRYWILRKFPLVNFAISQIELIAYLLKLTSGEKNLIIRAEDPRYNGILAYIFTRLKHRPFIVGSWGNPDSLRKYTKAPLQPRVFRTVAREKSCERFLLKRADCILVQNADNLNYVVSYGAKKESVKYFRLGNAIYPSHYLEVGQRNASEKALGLISHPGLKICTISRLEGLKLIDHTIKAFHGMKSSTGAHLYLFGEGSQRENLINLARDLGIEDRVHFLGNIDQETLANLLPLMDLVLSPSMGRALTEVALAERPIVAYDIDCHPEIVIDGESGLLVEYLNIKEMSEKGDYMLENPSRAVSLGKMAREVAMDLMDPEKLINEQRQVFLDLLS